MLYYVCGNKKMERYEMNNFFKVSEQKSSFKKEIFGGITIFLSMVYILAVNPAMIAETGASFEAVFLATALVAGVSSILMGLFANLPVGVAPGMGTNAFITYSVCLVMGIPFEQALFGVLIAGILFFILSVTGVRQKVVNAIDDNIKIAVGVGIGFFITLIGLVNAGIIVTGSGTIVSLGNLADPAVLLAIFGIVVVAILYAMRVPLAIFIAMVITMIVGLLFGIIGMPESIVAMPNLSETYFLASIKNVSLATIFNPQI
jgi:adenine/guanine/hypoxanthine permease